MLTEKFIATGHIHFLSIRTLKVTTVAVQSFRALCNGLMLYGENKNEIKNGKEYR